MKNAFMFIVSGMSYRMLEILWNGNSHWIMFIVGGAAFLIISMVNERFSWDFPFLAQCLIIAIIIVIIEFAAGCILNLYLKMNIWDYSGAKINLLGQICLKYALLWLVLSAAAIIADDILKWKLFKGEKPRYKIL